MEYLTQNQICEEEIGRYFAHHGVLNQKWGVRHGPPYPLNSSVSTGNKIKSRYAGKSGGPINDYVKKKRKQKEQAARLEAARKKAAEKKYLIDHADAKEILERKKDFSFSEADMNKIMTRLNFEKRMNEVSVSETQAAKAKMDKTLDKVKTFADWTNTATNILRNVNDSRKIISELSRDINAAKSKSQPQQLSKPQQQPKSQKQPQQSNPKITPFAGQMTDDIKGAFKDIGDATKKAVNSEKFMNAIDKTNAALKKATDKTKAFGKEVVNGVKDAGKVTKDAWTNNSKDWNYNISKQTLSRQIKDWDNLTSAEKAKVQNIISDASIKNDKEVQDVVVKALASKSMYGPHKKK